METTNTGYRDLMALDEDELIDLTMATISFLERRREAERRALDDAMP